MQSGYAKIALVKIAALQHISLETDFNKIFKCSSLFRLKILKDTTYLLLRLLS